MKHIIILILLVSATALTSPAQSIKQPNCTVTWYLRANTIDGSGGPNTSAPSRLRRGEEVCGPHESFP